MKAFKVETTLVAEGAFYLHEKCAAQAGEGVLVGAVPVGTTCAWCEGEDGLPKPICAWCHDDHEFTDCPEINAQFAGDDSYDFGCQDN